jgi:dTDP-glucose 4,6-dehydratase
LKVLVTGGAGFIGSNFVRRALGGNYPAITNISVLDSLTYAGNLENLSSVMNSPRFEFVQGSILDKKLLGTMMSSADVLINFAAESHVDRSIENASKFVETNAVGVFEILEQLRKKSLRFLQVSTDEVYGSIANGTWTEESPLQPNSPYSASKASAELLCRAYHNTYGLDILVTRCSNNYGPYHHPEKFIPKSITNLLQNKPIKVYGNGLNSRDWIHVDDHCDGIYAAIQRGESGDIYNLGGKTELNNLELANKILGLMNRKSTEI